MALNLPSPSSWVSSSGRCFGDPTLYLLLYVSRSNTNAATQDGAECLTKSRSWRWMSLLGKVEPLKVRLANDRQDGTTMHNSHKLFPNTYSNTGSRISLFSSRLEMNARSQGRWLLLSWDPALHLLRLWGKSGHTTIKHQRGNIEINTKS